MQRLRNFPFSGAFQRGAGGQQAADPPEDKRAASAKALWPDNKAIVPEPAAPEAPSKKNAKSGAGKSEKRAAQKAARTSPKPLRLPPAPPLETMPPFGTLAASFEEQAPLSIAPRFSPAADLPPVEKETEAEAEAMVEAQAEAQEALLLTEPLTISPSFLPPEAATQSHETTGHETTGHETTGDVLAIRPHILGQNPDPPKDSARQAGAAPADEKLISALTAALHDNLGSLREVRNQLAQQSLELALAAARSIAGHAIAADSLQILRARLPELLAQQTDAPPLQISVSPQDEAAARTLVLALAKSHGYQGQIMIEADQRLECGDAMVNWRHYAWRSLVAERRATVEASVSRYLAQLQDSQLPPFAERKDDPHGG